MLRRAGRPPRAWLRGGEGGAGRRGGPAAGLRHDGREGHDRRGVRAAGVQARGDARGGASWPMRPAICASMFLMHL